MVKLKSLRALNEVVFVEQIRHMVADVGVIVPFENTRYDGLTVSTPTVQAT